MGAAAFRGYQNFFSPLMIRLCISKSISYFGPYLCVLFESWVYKGNTEGQTHNSKTSPQGVGRRYAHVVLRKADIDLTKRAGELTEDEVRIGEGGWDWARLEMGAVWT